MKAIVLLSGGLDSSTALGMALAEGYDVLALSIMYGQKHKIELKAATDVAYYYHVPHIIKQLDVSLFSDSGSALIDSTIQIPHSTYAEQGPGPVSTVVPFRNANFLSVATALAIVHGCDAVYIGVHADDSHNWAYPDCTPEFIGAMANAIFIGSYNKVRLISPFVWWHKADIIKAGLALNVPYHLTYSCYSGAELSCGVCATCRDRIAAFAANGVVDPIMYALR